MKRDEFDNKIKEILIENFAYKEFKISWDNLSKILNMPLQKTKYHILKLEDQGFLKLIQRAKRGDGITSPNIIRINEHVEHLKKEEIEDKKDEALEEINEILDNLKQKIERVSDKDAEIKRLKLEISNLENSNRQLNAVIFDLKNKILEINRVRVS